MKYDAVIIGGGQAGLAMGYYLKERNVSFLIVDASSEIGETWKKRYDSLRLFTPDYLSSLPGLRLEANSYPTKDEIANYLKLYAKTFTLPVQLNTKVTKLFLNNDVFMVETSKGSIQADNVIVATGPFQVPNIPRFSKNLSEEVLQLHSSEYKNPDQIRKGSVLVVGGGNSGSQIAVELVENHKVYLSIGHKMRFLPQEVGHKSIFWYLDRLGVYKARHDSPLGKILKNKPDPIFGFELKKLIKEGTITLVPRAHSSKNNTILFQDNSQIKIDNIIWATGYKPDYGWIKFSEVIDSKGSPIHNRGITSIKGLYFLGLPWQHNRSSALIQGVGDDARHISSHLNK